VAGRYRASFVGYFPTDQPKYSCIVVVNDPRGGSYYGATVAAPVFKELADKIYSTEMEFHRQMAVSDSAVLALVDFPASKNARAEDLKTIYKAFKMPMRDLSTGEWVASVTKKDTVLLNDRSVRPGLVPDVVGMGLSDAIFLLESQGLKVKTLGYGTVKRQSVAAGSMIRNNKTITIELL
jgi:cell division protein FtsI (penicillin-binding protein 3)